MTIVRASEGSGDLKIKGKVTVAKFEVWDVTGTLEEDGEWVQGCVRREKDGRTGFVRVRLWTRMRF